MKQKNQALTAFILLLKMKNKAFYISLTLHLILIAATMLYKISINKQKVKMLELVEFKLEGTSKRGISPGKPVINTAKKGVLKKAPVKLNLPKALVKDNDININTNNSLNSDDLKINSNIGLNNYDKNLGKLSKKSINLEKAELTTGLSYLKSLEGKLSKGTSKTSPYILEGEAAFRTVTKKVLPVYPKGLQKNAKVKLYFDLLANGTVKNIMVVKKVDVALEKAGINALKQWKFNAIAENKTQKGQITFIFELK